MYPYGYIFFHPLSFSPEIGFCLKGGSGFFIGITLSSLRGRGHEGTSFCPGTHCRRFFCRYDFHTGEDLITFFDVPGKNFRCESVGKPGFHLYGNNLIFPQNPDQTFAFFHFRSDDRRGSEPQGGIGYGKNILTLGKNFTLAVR